jgi:uncharacterized protein (TIGR02145 family)
LFEFLNSNKVHFFVDIFCSIFALSFLKSKHQNKKTMNRKTKFELREAKKHLLYLTTLIFMFAAIFVACKKEPEPEPGIPTPVAVMGVTLSEKTVSLVPGDFIVLHATVMPDSAENKAVTWSSSNPTVATVDNDGRVTAIDFGMVYIVVTTTDGNHRDTCIVTVANPVLSITLNQTTTSRIVGSTTTLTATVLPENATNQTVTWTSNRSTVASVDQNGVVTTRSPGSVTITATASSGLTATRTFTVVQSCNSKVPAFGSTLGVVTFATDTEWPISGNGITQTWSDVVEATNCNKTTFFGGTFEPGLNMDTDCRSGNPGFAGSLFSWCAVIRFQDELCPYPWRVPTRQDFRNLDIAMGGNGEERMGDHIIPFIESTYMNPNVWGGVMQGWGNSEGWVGMTGLASYWSQTEEPIEDDAYSLYINPLGHLHFDIRVKNGASPIRCVK